MTTMLQCLVILLLSGISLINAQRTFGGAFDGNDMLNANTGGVDDTLRGFDPNMRIPRFRNRRLGDLPRPLQMEVINSLIANGVRGSRVANGVVNGAGIRTGGVDINTRRFAANGAQGRGFGVDTFTATGTNGGGVGARRFTVNNRFGDTLSSTRIGRIPPATGGQTIDLGATRTNGRIGGRPGVRTTRLTGGMPRSGILGGLGSNVDDLFLDPVSGRRVLVRPVGVANNIVNQRTNGDGGIGGGVPDIPPMNGFRDMNGGRRFPTPTFAGGPQANFRRQQLPIFPPNGMTGPSRVSTMNEGFPNDRDLGNALTFDSVNPALFNTGMDSTSVDTDFRSIALPRGTINRDPIAPSVRRGSRININLRPLGPSGGTASAIDDMSRSRQFNVDGNVDIDIGVPTFNRRLTGIDIPDTRATIDMTSRVPTTSGRSETVRTTTRIDGGVSDVTGSRIDPIDNTIDGAGMAIDGSSVKTTTIKRTGSNGLVDSNSQGVITRTTTTTTRRLAEAGITGESAVSIEKQLQAIEQQLVAAAGVDRPVFAVIPMNDQANQADFNEFLRNMTNANQVNIIDRKSVSSINTDSRNNGIGVDGNSRSSITVDGGGVARDGISRVSESRSSSSNLFDSTNTVTRTSSGTGLGDSSLAGSGTGGSRTITKKTTIRRISPAGSDLGLDGFGTDFGTSSSTSVVGDIGTSMGNDIGTSFTGDIGTSMGGDIGTSFGTDGTQGGGFSTTRVETSGGMTGGSGIIDSSMTNTGLVDTSLPSSSVFATDMPVMNDVGSLPDPMLL
nr:cell wall protein IFF6 isoform X4 [Crassostrea gigas]